jgi:hypothetical protein
MQLSETPQSLSLVVIIIKLMRRKVNKQMKSDAMRSEEHW